jgi:general nucleoside transport system ATP-binding protein
VTTPAGASARDLALQLAGIRRTFGDIRAVDDVDLAVATGSVHALLGENGAGKTTLMRIAYGLVAPEAGSVRHFGMAAAAGSVRASIRAGVGMVHQQLSLVPALTAAENVALGGAGPFSPRDAADHLRRVSEASGLRVPPEARAADLSIVEQQRLEILKALSRGARLLILDEPTTGLAPSEIEELLHWIRAFADGGGAVVLVTHRLQEALAVADDVTVLRRGRVVDSGAARGRSVESLARAIFPETAAVEAPAPPVPGDIVATLTAAAVRDRRGVLRLRPSTLQVRRGEILGIAAVEGSGHRELLALLAGAIPPSSGEVELPQRIAVVPSDRLREALVPGFSLVENFALRGAGERVGLMPWKAITDAVAAAMARFSVVAPSPWARAATLSGGNQQRFVIARELSRPVDLVIADDPSRGLDLRSTQFVHAQLRAAAAQGAAVVVHASDLDEVLALSTRVIVVFHGDPRVVAIDRELVGRAMLGAA